MGWLLKQIRPRLDKGFSEIETKKLLGWNNKYHNASRFSVVCLAI